ncbi:MAG: ABC transporter substrate-binding protein [Trueperaceae bacterium]
MRRSQVFRSVIFALLSLIIAGAGFAQAQVLRIAYLAGPPTLDPHLSTTRATADIAINVFETLVGYGEDFSPQPQLATSWDISEDGLSYTFHLRQGVNFHDGSAMTSEDVVASIDRVREKGAYRARFADVTDVSAVDDATVQMTLAAPNAALLIALADPLIAIIPAEVADKDELTNEDLIGTGPFRFVEWLPDQHVRLARFDGYVQHEGTVGGNTGPREVHFDEVLFVPVPEEGARSAGLETGEYHIVDGLPYGAGRRLMESPDVQVLQFVQYMKPFIYINQKSDRPTGDINIRRAIQAALNHDEIMAVASEGYGTVDPSIGFGVWSTDAGSEFYDIRDPELARQYLAAAGYDGTPIVLVTNTDYDVMYRSALMIERQLEQVGFEVEVQVYDWAGSRAVRDTFEYDLFISGHLLQVDPSVIEFHLLPETSPFAYDDPVAADLLRQGRTTTDLAKRQEIYAELQRRVFEQVAWIKLFDQNTFQGVRGDVEGYTPWPYIRAWNVTIGD